MLPEMFSCFYDRVLLVTHSTPLADFPWGHLKVVVAAFHLLKRAFDLTVCHGHLRAMHNLTCSINFNVFWHKHIVSSLRCSVMKPMHFKHFFY